VYLLEFHFLLKPGSLILLIYYIGLLIASYEPYSIILSVKKRIISF